MTDHRLKCWPHYFDAIERGEKTFEVRYDDRGFQRGDTLVLVKFDPEKPGYVLDRSAQKITLRRRVSYVLAGGRFGIDVGHVVMALEPVDEVDSKPIEGTTAE